MSAPLAQHPDAERLRLQEGERYPYGQATSGYLNRPIRTEAAAGAERQNRDASWWHAHKQRMENER